MTSEEIQAALTGLLSVQQELQKSQLEFGLRLDQLTTVVESNARSIEALSTELRDLGQKWDRQWNQVIGYSINRERDWLDVTQDIHTLKTRVSVLEQQFEGKQ